MTSEADLQANTSERKCEILSLARRLSLKHKLIAIIMLTCVLALSLVGGVLFAWERTILRRTIVRDLSMHAQVLAENCKAALAFGDHADATKVLQAAEAVAPIMVACVYTADGGLFAAYSREGTVPAVPPAGQLKDHPVFERGFLVLTRPILLDDEKIGVVCLTASLDFLRKRLKQEALAILGVLLLSSLSACLISSRLQCIISRPILGLAEVARFVAENKQYTVRAEPSGNDEVGLLIRTFNEMLEQIQQRDAALTAANENLETRVRERTAELSSANAKLAYLASFPERNPGPVMEVDLDGNPRYANPATLRLFPDLHERGAAHPWLADWPAVAAQFREGQTDTAVRDVTVGGRSYEQLLHYFVRDRFVRVYAVDITERVQAENQVQQDAQTQSVLNGLLSLSLQNLTVEEMLEEAIEHITSLTWVAWSKGAIFLVDDKQQVLTLVAQRGLDPQMLVRCARVPFGVCVCGRAALSGELEFTDRVDERHDRVFESMEPHGHYCVPILSAGKVFGVVSLCVEEGHQRSRKEEGFLRTAAAVVAGIIERKRAEKRQLQLLQQLAEINQELADFAYVVSHDLKAPLRAIRTLADWLCVDYQDKLDEQGKENLQLLNNRVDRMQSLIDGVLQYSRIGRTEQEKVPVDLSLLVPQIVESLGAPGHISVHIDPGLPAVEGDTTRITQVFQNLLSNAIKYMDKPQGSITVACVEEGAFWKFGVSDNGPGIEQKNFDRIFKLFQTLAPSDGHESTGVGLTIVKKVVEMYGGKVWVQSHVGQGSTFFFTLPKLQMEVNGVECETVTACTR